MGAGLRFFSIDNSSPALAEFERLKTAMLEDAAFLVGRLARVQIHGTAEAEDDQLDAEQKLYAYAHGKAMMIYTLEVSPVGTFSVVTLTFGNLDDEEASVIVNRAISRRHAILTKGGAYHGR